MQEQKATGFLLVVTRMTREREVYSAIKEDQRTVYAEPLLGDYEIIAKVEVSDGFSGLENYRKDINNNPGVLEAKLLTGIKF